MGTKGTTRADEWEDLNEGMISNDGGKAAKVAALDPAAKAAVHPKN